MKYINNYISEKLVISRDLHKRKPDITSERILEIAGADYNDNELKKIVDDWLGDYNKKIYYYYYELDHSRFKEFIKKYDNIIVQSIQDSVMKKTMNSNDFDKGEEIYNSKNEIKSIRKVGKNDLLIYADKCWYDYPIIVEKSSI